jgi:hypothetical protein
VTIPRYLLDKHFAGDNRMIRAMEDQSKVVTDGVAATSALADATVIVLSPNGDFTNERVLQVGDGIKVEITDDTVTLSVENVAMTQGYPVTLIAQGLTELVLPAVGTLVSNTNPQVDVSTLGAYANDAAAAAAGVPVGGLYRNSAATSQLMVRVA